MRAVVAVHRPDLDGQVIGRRLPDIIVEDRVARCRGHENAAEQLAEDVVLDQAVCGPVIEINAIAVGVVRRIDGVVMKAPPDLALQRAVNEDERVSRVVRFDGLQPTSVGK